LVGVEMGGNPLRGNWDEFRPLFQQARDAGLRVSLHFAENKGYEDEHEKILEFGPDRLGHAVFMSQNITEKVLQKRTPVEVCITCHEAYYKVDRKKNVFGVLKSRNHPAVLCCDNACLLHTILSKEWEVAIETFKLTAEDVQQMILDNVDAIFADNVTKQKLRVQCENRIKSLFTKSDTSRYKISFT